MNRYTFSPCTSLKTGEAIFLLQMMIKKKKLGDNVTSKFTEAKLTFFVLDSLLPISYLMFPPLLCIDHQKNWVNGASNRLKNVSFLKPLYVPMYLVHKSIAD